MTDEKLTHLWKVLKNGQTAGGWRLTKDFRSIKLTISRRGLEKDKPFGFNPDWNLETMPQQCID